MQSFHEALQAIAAAAHLPNLTLNANDFAEIVLGDDMVSIYFNKADESQLEISSRISAFDRRVSPELASVLLTENASLTVGRFALEGDRGVVLGHRIELGTATPDSLVAELNAFTRAVLLLERDGAAILLARAERYAPVHNYPETGMIRL